jgi:hypothetical protein
MKKIDWEILEYLYLKDTFYRLDKAEKSMLKSLTKETRKEDEHPEWYECWCECCLCMSYAD